MEELEDDAALEELEDEELEDEELELEDVPVLLRVVARVRVLRAGISTAVALPLAALALSSCFP